MSTRVQPRKAVGTLAGLAATQILIWIAAAALAEETSTSQQGLSVLLGLLSAVLLASLGEWTVHRYSMHTPWRNRLLNIPYELHHVAHHWHHYTPDRFTHAGPVKYHPTSDPSAICATNAARYWVATQQFIYYMFFALVFLFTPAWLITGNIPFMIGLIPPIPVVCVLFVHVHDTTHHPGNRLIERFGWFRFLKHHHYIHHIDNGSNVNFLLPLCDLLFGTLRTKLQPGELARWGTFEDALARVVPMGEGRL
jgi:ABC-type nickel/cobalt efflux system permease component RcnA